MTEVSKGNRALGRVVVAFIVLFPLADVFNDTHPQRAEALRSALYFGLIGLAYAFESPTPGDWWWLGAALILGTAHALGTILSPPNPLYGPALFAAAGCLAVGVALQWWRAKSP